MSSFYKRFLNSAERFPQSVAVELQLAAPSTEVVSHTYAELRAMSEAVAAWLLARGVLAGERCAILAANHPRWVAAYLGVQACGGVAVPLDVSLKIPQLTKLLDDSGSSILFTDAKNLPAAQEASRAARKAPLLVLLSRTAGAELPTLDEMFASEHAALPELLIKPDDTAVILYTSGTTSDPKGVMLTHANLEAEAEAVFRFIRIDEHDAILGVLPLFHALAQMANLLFPYSAGTRVVYMEQLNTTELMRALSERNITLFCCVPQFFYLIHDKVMKQVEAGGGAKKTVFKLLMAVSRASRTVGLNLGKVFFAKVHKALGSKMRYLITGGSRFDPAIGRDLETLGFDILQAYGLTETSGGAVVSPLKSRFNGSVGKPLPGVEVKIVKREVAEGDGEERGDGEIAIRGGIVMKGYYNRPDATEKVLRDGWLHTGDLGWLDKDGCLFITGRSKEVIVLSSGKNIYPEEVEAHYAASPFIKEICVVGLQSKPGEPFSERLHGVIVPDFELLRQKKIVNVREILRYEIEGLSAEIGANKRILSYDIWQGDLPRTSTRKVKRFEIQKMVESGFNGHSASSVETAAARELTPADQAWLEREDVAPALEVIRSAAKKGAPVHPSDNLELDLGLDSMERVELVVALEQRLARKADESLISDVYSVRELVETVLAGKQTGNTARPGWKEVFAAPVTDPEVLAVIKHRPMVDRAWFLFGRLVNLASRIFFRLKVEGVEKLPPGPFILCPNHQSFLDAPLLVAQLPYRTYKDLFYVGTSEIFGGGLMRRLARSLKLVPVDPDSNLVQGMRAGAFGLQNSKTLVLYPEGERSIDGVPKTFKKGAAILAYHTNVPLVPVAQEGFYEVWPRGKGFQGLHRMRIAIGDPIYPQKGAQNPEEAYEEITTKLKNEVMKMWTRLHAENNGRK